MTDEVRFRLLDEALLSVADVAGRHREMSSLPELYAALVRGTVGDFPALRPHQRHVWHAFLVQVGALALHRAGLAEPPDDADAWRRLLLGLTPDDPDGAAWALVSPHARPALLQPPVPNGDVSAFKPVDTPDALDMLVTAKNHDLKRGAVSAARPEHWVYALVSLQTQEGFLGAGNYGISRMNGGFANRPGFGISPAGGSGARVVRDIRRLLAVRLRLLEDYPSYPTKNGIGIVWTVPWDGRTALSPDRLDVYYVEVCRRVRLVADDDGLHAVAAGSSVARIEAKGLSGRTGDPWTPLVVDGDGRKAFTADAGGFTYKRLVPLLFPVPSDPKAPFRAPLQEVAADDPDSGLAIVARAVVRGQGKTEGFQERRVPVSKTMQRFLGPEVASDEGAMIARARVEDVGQFSNKVLFPAMMAVYTAAPSTNERKRDDDTAKARARAALATFDREVDATFFADLDAELAHSGDADARGAVRAAWLRHLLALGRAALATTLRAAPTAAMRRYRTPVRARSRLEAAFIRQFGDRIGVEQAPPPLTSAATDA